jgi:hypothetical protein
VSHSGSFASNGIKFVGSSHSSNYSSVTILTSVKLLFSFSTLYAEIGLMTGSKLKVGIYGSSCFMKTLAG